jgi:hypothetical protein
MAAPGHESRRAASAGEVLGQLPEGGREFTRRHKAVVDHYGVKSTRIEPRKSNQNGVAEKSNDLLKRRIDQALVIRGSRDFESVAEYEVFVRGVLSAGVHDRREAGGVASEASQHGHLGRPVHEPTDTTSWDAAHRAG